MLSNFFTKKVINNRNNGVNAEMRNADGAIDGVACAHNRDVKLMLVLKHRIVL